MKMNTKNNVVQIIAIASLVLVIGGLAIVPAMDHQAQAIVSPKDIKSKVTDFLKKLKDRLTHGSGGGGGCLTCG